MSEAFNRELLGALPKLRKLAWKWRHSKAGAEDLVQDTLEKALRQQDQYTLGTAIMAWLFHLMRSSATNASRRERTEARCCARINAPITVAPVQHTVVELKEALGLIQGLSPKFNGAIKYCILEERTYEEAAALANIPPGTMRSRVNKARIRLRRGLGSEWGIQGPS